MDKPTPSYPYQPDKADPIGYLRSQEQMAREHEVKVQSLKLLQDEIKLCYRREGTNHYQNCRELAEKYRSIVKDPTFNWFRPSSSEE